MSRLISQGLLILLGLLCLHGTAQQRIKGTVKDAKTGQPIPYPAIGISGTSKGTLGDQNGYFELQVDPAKDTLDVSAMGYESSLLLPVNAGSILLAPAVYNLNEVTVQGSQGKFYYLGTKKYSKGACTAFIGENSNWRGEQAAVKIENKDKKPLYLESFGFYIIRNEYEDSLHFRLMLYDLTSNWGYPGRTFLKKPILFKTKVKEGEVRVDLTPYNITWDKDFFVSLECLEEKMEASKFCFAGAIKVPSYVKLKPFGKWTRVRGGGGAFNLRVSELETK